MCRQGQNPPGHVLAFSRITLVSGTDKHCSPDVYVYYNTTATNAVGSSEAGNKSLVCHDHEVGTVVSCLTHCSPM